MSKEPYPHGTFCWAELATSDAADAKCFYTALLGWQADDDPLPSGGVYTMFRHQDGYVGALYELTAEMREQGVATHWLLYVSVDNARAMAARAAELGGTVVKDAFDVFEIGSMAVLQDPTGATFAVWQPKASRGTDFIDGRPGTVCWNELATRDAEAAAAFYCQLFGWRQEQTGTTAGPYTLFMAGDRRAAGMLQMTEEWGEAPPHWMLYFSVIDCDSSAARVRELGGEVLKNTEIPPAGRFSVLSDPQGAYFSIIRPTPEEEREMKQ
jgi:predicted enzyme related to lactoylglutathione lyase